MAMEVARQALFVLSCLIFIRASTSDDIDPNWKTFTDPLNQEYLTLHVLVHNVTGDVYLASTNNLYHLDADLVLKTKVSLGPRSVCSTPGTTTCSPKSSEKFVPHSIAIAYHLDSLVMCGSLYNGSCEIRPLSDLKSPSWIGPDGDEISRCTAAVGDPGFFAGSSFFTGADHLPNDIPFKETKHFMASKVLLRENGEYKFKYTHQTDSTRSAITFHSKETQIIIYYFSHGSYVYYLFLRATRSTLTTILARVCIDDTTFHSYIEQPISCKIGDKEYTISSSASVGPGKPGDPTSESLYVAFYRRNENAVVCDFDIAFMDIFFSVAINDCSKGGNSSHLINLDDGTHSPCKVETNTEKTCGSNINPYIYHDIQPVGRLGLVVNVPDFQITSLAIFVEKNETMLFIGAKPAVFAKMVYGKNVGLHAAHSGGSLIQKSNAFDLKREHIYFLASSKVIKFPIMTCSIYLTCKACFHADDDPLLCGWCDGRCSQVSECSKPETFSRNKCSPTIYKVEPMSGPAEGGTHITIQGKNFGPQNRTKGMSLVWVAGTLCRVLLWDDERILCITTGSSTDKTGFVEVIIRDSTGSFPFAYHGSAKSNETFKFISPRLFGIEPDRGSISGGTSVTLFGRNFNIGQEHRVNIRGRICTNLRVENDTATCITGRSKDISLQDTIEMKVGDIVIRVTDDDSPNKILVSKHFEYLPDPEIYKIYPTDTLLRYEGNITVTGRYLDGAKEPKMEVNRINSNGQLTKYDESCIHTPKTNGTIMTCSLSAMGRNILDLMKPTTDRKPSLEVALAFTMFPFKPPDVSFAKLNFYHEPWFEPFTKAQKIVNNETHLEIKGIFPEPVNLTGLLKIQIGENEICNISDFTWDTLRCELSSGFTTNASVWGDHLSIQVQSGSERKILGYLVIEAPFKPEEPAEGSSATWPIIVGIILVICLVSSIGVWYYLRRRAQRNKHRGFSSPIHGSVAFRNDYRPVANHHQVHEVNTVPSFGETTARLPPVRTFSREPSTSTTTSLISRTPSIAPSVVSSTSLLSREPSIEPFTSTTSRTPSIVPDMISAPLGYLNMNKPQNGSRLPMMIQPIQPLVNHPNQQTNVEQELSRYLEQTIDLLKFNGILLERERLTVLEVVGGGQFGDVFEGEYNCPRQGAIQVAVKEMRDCPELQLIAIKEFLDEGIKMKDFKHENVLSLIGVCFENQKPMIVSPYMENGDLCCYLRNKLNELLLADLRKFATHAAAGMTYLSREKYVHRDLAARNCVLDTNMKLKIADFGLSRDVYESEYYRTSNKRLLPVKWMSPESLENGIYTVKSDVWSYGVLLWEIFTRGVIPYEETHNWALTESLKNGLRLPKPQRCSKKLYVKMLECWQMDPKKRPDFDTLYTFLTELSKKISYNERLQSVPAQNKEYDNFE